MSRGKLCDFIGMCIICLLLCAFLFVTVNGLFVTCEVEIFYSEDNNEHVIFTADNPLLLLAEVAILLLLLWLLLRRPVTKERVQIMTGIMLLFSSALSAWWIIAAKAVPYADSKTVLDAVQNMLSGNEKALLETDYFIKYPYQLGFAWYAECIGRLFGSENLYLALSIFNIVFLDAIALALLAISRRLFHDLRVEFLTAVLLLVCLQPAFLTTFLYGLYPGLTLALWGSYFVIRFLQSDRWIYLLPAALLIGGAILLKQNHRILLVAVLLALLLHALRKKRFAALLGAALILLAGILLPQTAQKHYETVTESKFGEGTPFTAWLMTGLSESSFCSGWFNSYPITIMPENGYDPAAAAAQIRADVRERSQYLLSKPRYLCVFFYHKLTSHWNEPTFQSIWSSAADEHSGTLSPLADSLSYGNGNRAFIHYCNAFDQLVYMGFVFALILLFKRERRTEDRLLLPLTILGIFLYHALFEAKAQYALPPFLMMLPYAAYGITAFFDKLSIRKARP